MNTLKLTSRLAACLTLVAAWSGTAVAQTCATGVPLTQTFTDPFGPEPGAWPAQVLMVPKATVPAGYTFVQAQVSFCGQVAGIATYTNTDTDVACTFTFQAFATVDAAVNDPAAPPALQNGLGLANITFSSPPITLQPGQTGNTTYNSGIQCIPGNPLTFTPGDADFNWFESMAGDTMVVVDHVGAGDATASGCVGLTFNTIPNTDLFLRVDYTFCPIEETTPPGGCRCTGPSPHYRRPGSLLLFPEFDNQDGAVTLVTVTNADCTRQSGDVTIEYKYINKVNCQEFNRTETLTPCDTLTLLTNFHNPGMNQGYLYVFAKDDEDNPIVFNNLIGNLLVISGLDVFDYSVNPVAFRGIGSATGIVQPDGTFTDLDDDGIRDLDNAEYDPAPDTITIPRFLGQGQVVIRSQLVLIALSGGSEFTEFKIDCLLYNDNEEDFSFDHTFYCWDKPFLLDVAPAASNNFLKSTEDDPDEIIGATTQEAGWICCDGATATSTQESIMDPAFYMVLVERVGTFGVADLPFECGAQLNGALLPRDILGDGDPIPMDGDNQ
jgi:hypothetical protein